MEQNSEPRNNPSYLWSITKQLRIYKKETMDSSINGLGTLNSKPSVTKGFFGHTKLDDFIVNRCTVLEMLKDTSHVEGK